MLQVSPCRADFLIFSYKNMSGDALKLNINAGKNTKTPSALPPTPGHLKITSNKSSFLFLSLQRILGLLRLHTGRASFFLSFTATDADKKRDK